MSLDRKCSPGVRAAARREFCWPEPTPPRARSSRKRGPEAHILLADQPTMVLFKWTQHSSAEVNTSSPD